MKKQTLWLIITMIVIIGAIVFLEVSKSSGPLEDATIELDDNIRTQAKAEQYEKAKELVGIEGYINSDNFTLQEYIGKKVILIDFWTYSCINCQRTLPYLNAWHTQYEDDGLLIVGVHAPEFSFEEDYENVINAVNKYNIAYPVVQDNGFQTWRAYENRFWPRKYLIDIDGYIVYDHIGEGAYEETENRIREALKERMVVLQEELELSKDTVSDQIVNTKTRREKTPELYLGYEYSRDQFGNEQGWVKDTTVTYQKETNQSPDKFYLSGTWFNNPQSMKAVENASLQLTFTGTEANIVVGSENGGFIQVFVDSELTQVIEVTDSDLYNVYKDEYATKELELVFDRDVEIYTFTFGS